MMADALRWRVERRGDTTVVTLSGAITEHATLELLAAELAGHTKLEFDLGSIQRINSCGVKEWLGFMRGLPAAAAVQFDNCSAPIVHQLNLVQGFAGAASVTTIRVPFVCDACGNHEVTTIPVERGVMPALAARACGKCKKPMELDDLAETYFAFLLR